MTTDRTQVILLPGGVLPAAEAYSPLLEVFGDEIAAVAKELEVYAGEEPPADYSLDYEVEGILRAAAAAGFERFHLVGYSGGGASSLAFASKHPERLLSLALLEPAWAGNKGLDLGESALWQAFGRVMNLPVDEIMPAFVRIQLAPGVQPPPLPSGPPPPWMAKRPAGLKAFLRTFISGELDLDVLRCFDPPVYFAFGGLSNPDYYEKEAERLSDVFEDFTVEVFEDRHHFDPPHRSEPERLAVSLSSLWVRAEQKRDELELAERARSNGTDAMV